MEIEIIKADTPTVNDRVYPKEELEKAIANVKQPLVGRFESSGTNPTNIAIEDIAFTVENLRIVDGAMVGDMTILEVPNKAMFEEILPLVRFAPAGTGMVDDSNSVRDYKILCIDAILDDEKK